MHCCVSVHADRAPCLSFITCMQHKNSSKVIGAIILFFIVEGLRLRVVTIATSETDGYQRFIRSAKLFDLDVEVSVL